MAKKEIAFTIKLQASGGQATPAPPIGPALGQHGVNIGQFVSQFNERTKDLNGTTVPVVNLQQRQELIFIDVTDAESATTGNGHAYFRKSPWTSSDILMTLMHDLKPDERGLVRSEDIPIWTFPPDYIRRLRAALLKVLPDSPKNLE